MTGGAAERAIGTHRRVIVEEMRAMASWPRPPYASSSAFRFVYDRSASRDIADTSALAKQLGVLERAVTEQAFQPALGPEPGTLQPTQPDERGEPAERVSVGAVGAAVDSVIDRSAVPGAVIAPRAELAVGDAGTDGTDGTHREFDVDLDSPSTEALLSVPATVAARERAEQASRALAKGWYREAESLFLEGAKLTPTDPFVWFGAGLAASRLDPVRAADHLAKASRFLLIDDPAGAAYSAIVSAALSEAAGDQRSARRLLQDRLDELARPCPAISLHLARLGPDRNARLAEAIAVDPMIEVDMTALGFELSGDTLKQRREQTEAELRMVDQSIAELRTVEAGLDGLSEPDGSLSGGPASAASDQATRQADDDLATELADYDYWVQEYLPLSQLEVMLWRKIRICENEIDLARRLVERQEAARRAKEAELESEAETADADLVHRMALPYVGLCVAILLAVWASYVGSRWLGSAVPLLATPLIVLAWLAQAALIVVAVVVFFRVWWPHRHYDQARFAKVNLAQLEWQATELRNAEFMVRRRYGNTSKAAVLKIGRIVDHRSALVPRRPAFVAPDLPLVPARR